MAKNNRKASEQSSTASNDAERLLNAWLGASTAIKNEKFVSELTYNESMICRLLATGTSKNGIGLTATELCEATQMKKSQMNRTLTALENKGLISRCQSTEDRRRQLITINKEQMKDFERQHDRIMSFVEQVKDTLGSKRTEEAIRALNNITEAIRKLTS